MFAIAYGLYLTLSTCLIIIEATIFQDKFAVTDTVTSGERE